MKRIKLSVVMASFVALISVAFLYGQQQASSQQPDQATAQQASQQKPDQPSAQPSTQSGQQSSDPGNGSQSSSTSQKEPGEMPKTASNIPLLALVGVLSLGGAGALHLVSKTRSVNNRDALCE